MNLTTARLTLRELTDADFDAVHRFGSSELVTRYQVWGPNSEADSRAFLALCQAEARVEPRASFQLAVVHKASGALLGGCGVTIGSWTSRNAEFGYTLGPESWGQGYGTEVARALVRFGFEELGLHRIAATCDVNNTASWKIMERLGMTREAHMRENIWTKGRWRSSYLYALLAADWRAQKKEGGPSF